MRRPMRGAVGGPARPGRADGDLMIVRPETVSSDRRVADAAGRVLRQALGTRGGAPGGRGPSAGPGGAGNRMAWGLPVSQPSDRHETAAAQAARQALAAGPGHDPLRPIAPNQHQAALPVGTGRPLSSALRGYFEPRFGTDLSGVRVHTGRAAARAAARVSAQAFTVGRDIVWGGAGPRHDSPAGRSLLAHELGHVTDPAPPRPGIDRTCMPAAIPPPATISLGGSGWNWEMAELCLQSRYPYRGIVGNNRDWRFLQAPPGSAEARDLDCFKSHLVAKSGMFLSMPDIIDFTRAEIYDVTTWGQERPHRIRLDADTGLATALAANPDCSGSGRVWVPGTWVPNPWYWLGGDLYMSVTNVRGLLLYDVVKDVTKELVTAAALAAILAAGKNMLGKRLVTAAATKAPPVAVALAAVTILVLVTTDAELAWGAEGDPIENLIKAIENEGETLPDEIKEALRNDPDLRAKVEAANKERDPSKRARALSKACLEIVAKNKDQFSREDLEALTTMVQVVADDKLPEKTPTVAALKKQAEGIRAGKKPDPQAGTATGGKGAPKADAAKTTADIEKDVAADRPTLLPETIRKIASAPELTRRLLDRVAAKTGTGAPLTDADIERLLAAVPADLTQAQFDAIVAKLEAGTSQKPADLITNLERQLAAVKKEAQAKTADELAKQHPQLSQAAREKLAAASPAARSMLEAAASSGAQGVSLTDESVDRFLKIFHEAVTPEKIAALATSLADAKPGQTIDEVLDHLEKAVKSAPAPAPSGTSAGAAKAQGEGAAGKGKGGGGGGKGKQKGPPEGQDLARMLVLLASKVGPNENRLEWDGKRPVTGSVKTSARYFGKLPDGTAYIARVTVSFSKVAGDEATYVIHQASKVYDLNANSLADASTLAGTTHKMTIDPERAK